MPGFGRCYAYGASRRNVQPTAVPVIQVGGRLVGVVDIELSGSCQSGRLFAGWSSAVPGGFIDE